jgi:hypothetical protein
MVGRDSVEPGCVAAVVPGSTESRPTEAHLSAIWDHGLPSKHGFTENISNGGPVSLSNQTG